MILSSIRRKVLINFYLISKMLKGSHLPNVYLNCVLDKQVDSVRYLGHFLTCELKTGYIEFAWLEYYADAIHSAIVNSAG